ncbi:hypothetical protein NQ314_004058 [Rhamnusium bicolor]|uniref:Uncharacterized protein n=1 Tax=Rhamnusium bicolor TaxID=1586634 RepID=A0AAV8ZM68_9CUCU|nr:hypothetical protein NQ314_004058 [Rhamnusium bicolor]
MIESMKNGKMKKKSTMKEGVMIKSLETLRSTVKIKKDDKYRKSSGSSTSRDKDKTASRHSSSSSSKDKSKDKKESKTSSSNNKDKVEKDKDKPEKERPEKEKIKTDKDRERSDRDKNKSSSSSSSKHSNSKDKDRGSSSSKKESSGKDKEKEKSRSSGSSTSKDSKSKSNHTDSKSKSSTDKYKKDEKNSHNGKHSSSSSSIKKEKDRKRDSKKELKDDHYSSKEKKNYRRSTDRDSNDGQSSRQSQSNSFTESSSSHTQKNSQESSNSNSGSGSGESGNSDQIEQIRDNSPVKFSGPIENKEVTTICADIQKFKYMKPKFASNFEEARKLMKIRKQLAKLERQNQLSLAQIEVSVEIPAINGVTHTEENNTEEVDKIDDFNTKPQTPENKEIISSPKDVTPMLQSTELSKENWEALEARLAQEMSNINYNSYESPYDYDYDYAGYNSIVLSPRKNIVADKKHIVKEENIDKTLNCSKLDYEKEEELPSEKKQDVLVVAFKQPSQEVVVKKHPKNNIEKRRELRVELEASIYKSSKGVIKIIEKGEKCIRGNLSTKNGDKYRQDVIGNKKIC